MRALFGSSTILTHARCSDDRENGATVPFSLLLFNEASRQQERRDTKKWQQWSEAVPHPPTLLHPLASQTSASNTNQQPQFPILATCRLSGEPIRSIQGYEFTKICPSQRCKRRCWWCRQVRRRSNRPSRGRRRPQEEARASQGTSRVGSARVSLPCRDLLDAWVDSVKERWERSCMAACVEQT